jgi:hypothetical protein
MNPLRGIRPCGAGFSFSSTLFSTDRHTALDDKQGVASILRNDYNPEKVTDDSTLG